MGWGWGSAAEHVPCMLEALGSPPTANWAYTPCVEVRCPLVVVGAVTLYINA